MFEFLVAFRYLWLQRKTRAIFSTSLISVLGISAGVFSLNVVLAVMSGFQTELRKTILGASAHVLVSSYEGSIEDYARIEKKITFFPGVKKVSPVIYGTGLLVSEYSSQGTTVSGVNAASYKKTFSSISPETEESPDGDTDVFSILAQSSRSSRAPIVIGRGLAESLGVSRGDMVTLLFAPDKKKTLQKRPKTQPFEVAAIFSYGMAHYDSVVSYMNLPDAIELFQKSGPESFEVEIEDPLQSELVARELEETLGFPFVAQSWQEANRKLFSALRLEKLGLTIFLSFIVVVASLSIMSVLLMMMVEKSREIAILRAAGASGKQVGNIFLLIGASLGFTGTLLGTVGSFAVCYLLATSATVTSLIPFDPEVYGISKFPVIIEPFYFLLVGTASQLFCVLAAVYPAYCASGDNIAAKLKAQ